MSSRSKLSDRVYDHLIGLIIAGTVEVGAKLQTETDLAAALGVSRPIVREALVRLRDDGLVQSRRGSGTTVVRRPQQVARLFAPIGSIADLQRCFVFRVAVEGEAAALAARSRQPDDLLRLQDAARAFEMAAEQGLIGVEEDVDFHMAVAEATGNHFFPATLGSIREQLGKGMELNHALSLARTRNRLLTVHREHQAIVSAIDQGNEDDARRLMREHLASARRRVFEGDE